MTTNGRTVNPLTPDFQIEFADGGTMTSDDVLWDQVPKDRAIKALRHGAQVLDVGEMFAFEWEAIARMPQGAPGGINMSQGTIVAVRLYAIKDGQGCMLRVDQRGDVGVWRGRALELLQRLPMDRWRGQAGVPA